MYNKFPFSWHKLTFPAVCLMMRSPSPSEAYGGGWEGLGKEGLGCAIVLAIHLNWMSRKWKCSNTTEVDIFHFLGL